MSSTRRRSQPFDEAPHRRGADPRRAGRDPVAAARQRPHRRPAGARRLPLHHGHRRRARGDVRPADLPAPAHQNRALHRAVRRRQARRLAELAIAFIRAAEADHEQVLVAFYHSEYTPTVLPSVSSYQHDVEKFVKRFPHVRQYQSWDESNRGNVRGPFSSPSAVRRGALLPGAAARLPRLHGHRPRRARRRQHLHRRFSYISEFKREITHLHTVMPSIWGLHNYSDINRLQSWRTHQLVHALGGQVWLTETGGMVKFRAPFTQRPRLRPAPRRQGDSGTCSRSPVRSRRSSACTSMTGREAPPARASTRG